MNRTCPPVEEVAGLAGLPDSDPRRAHLRDCPRCRAVLLSYRSFMDERTAAATPGRARAEARLAAALEGMDTAPGAREAEDQLASPGSGRLGGGRGAGHAGLPGRRLPWLGVRRLGLALGVAAALAAASGLWLVLAPQSGGEGAPRLRGPEGPAGGVQGWRLEAPASLEDGSVQLDWTGPAADPAATRSYRVEIYDAGLATIASLGPVSEPTVVLGADLLQRLAGAPLPWRWRVIALREGDAVGQSPLAVLRPAP